MPVARWYQQLEEDEKAILRKLLVKGADSYKVCTELGMSRRAAQELLARMWKAGMVEKEWRSGARGRGRRRAIYRYPESEVVR